MPRRRKRRKSRPPRTKRQRLRPEQISVTGEANYIIQRARSFDARVVTLGPLVFFSTETGDAWMLDPEDGLALCLALEGGEQPYTIVETSTDFSIEWNANYRIDGDKFIVADQSDRVKVFFGYPTAEISRASRRAR
jgi:hypothetical protein